MIRASYSEMQNAANEISKAAGEYKGNVDSLYQTIDGLVNNWKGSDNVNYANTVNQYKESLKSLGDVINNYAQFLNKAATTISDTQDEVSSAAGRL